MTIETKRVESFDLLIDGLSYGTFRKISEWEDFSKWSNPKRGSLICYDMGKPYQEIGVFTITVLRELNLRIILAPADIIDAIKSSEAKND